MRTTNIGLFADGDLSGVRQCGTGAIQADPNFREPDYVLYGPVYKDDIMRQAVIKLGERRQNPADYCLIGKNCQNYGDDLRAEYARLLDQRQR